MNEQPNLPVMPAEREPVFQTWMRALTRPNESTYAAMAASPNAKASTGYLWYFIGSIVQVLLAAMVQNTLMRNYFSQYAGDVNLNIPTSIVGVICAAPIGAAISTLLFAIGAAIVQWIARMFGGRGTNDQLAYVLSNILTPYLIVSGLFTLLSAIPYVGFCFGGLALVAGIYILVLEIMAVKGVNQFGWGPAIASLLIPGLVIFLACACLVGGLFALLVPVIREAYPQLQQSLPQY